MASENMLLVFFLGLLTISPMLRESEAVRIDITPDKCIGGMQIDVQISCTQDTKFRDILMVEISKKDSKPIVYLRERSNVSYGLGHSKKFQAQGSIDESSQPNYYLNLTVTNVKGGDSGVYTCVVHYLDAEGVIQSVTSSKRLVVEKFDVKSLEMVLETMRGKITSLEENCQCQGDSSTSNMSAFSVTNRNKVFLLKKDMVVVFPDVITRVGEGYNTETGVFVAPLDGVYAFQLSAMTRGRYPDAVLGLFAKGQVLARLEVGEYSASLSTVAHLSAGDEVKVAVTESDGGVLVEFQFSFFSGYLIKTL